MSVLTMSTAATNKLFMEYIKPGLETQYWTNTKIYGRFKTNKDTCLGKYGVQKVTTRGARSFRPSSSSTFPTSGQGSYDEFHFYMKRGAYASLQFDGLAIACSKGEGAIKDLIKTEVAGITDYGSHKLNHMFWSDGSGRLAQLSAAISNTTTGYTDGPWFGQDANGYTPPSLYLAEDMEVDIYSTAGVLEAEAVKISAISEGGAGTDTLTIGSAVTASNNAYIFDHDTYAAAEAAGTGVPMGLYGIINTANSTVGITATSAFQGVDRSSNTWAQAQLFNMSSAAITNAKLIEAVQKCERFGTTSVIITNDVIWRAIYQQWEADKTMPNTKSYWGGTQGLSFYAGKKQEIPIIYDYDCPDNRMYLIDDSTIVISAPNNNGMDWVKGENGTILRMINGKDEWAAHLVWYYNMTCSKPQANGCIYAVKHAAS
jgi:hypothetical protein